MYIPGTLIIHKAQNDWKMDMRGLIIFVLILNAIGAITRFVSDFFHNDSPHVSYCLVLLGTCVSALAQPYFLNMPAALASLWFPLKERDNATTLCSLANPLGSAIGSILPAIFVIREGDDDDGNVEGVRSLLLTQMTVAIITLMTIYISFQPRPRLPPTKSAAIARQINGNNGGNDTEKNGWDTSIALFMDTSYLLLFLGFTTTLAHLNALAALLNQIPGNYTNAQSGGLGAILIMAGFMSALVTGKILDHTKAYRECLKTSFTLAMIAWITFLSLCEHNGNYAYLATASALLGASLLPIAPCAIVNSVECVYPLSGDIAVGLLYCGANVLAIPYTFIGEILLRSHINGPGAPFFPYGIWVIITMTIAYLAIMFYKGNYSRLVLDKDISVDREQSHAEKLILEPSRTV